jgi:hypothetical protein
MLPSASRTPAGTGAASVQSAPDARNAPPRRTPADSIVAKVTPATTQA